MHNFSCNTLEFALLKIFCAFGRVALRRFLGKDHVICLPEICLVALVSQTSEERGPERASNNVQKIISIREKTQLWHRTCTENSARRGFETLDLIFGIQMPWMLLGGTAGSSSTSGIAIPESLLWQSSPAPAHRGFHSIPFSCTSAGLSPPWGTTCKYQTSGMVEKWQFKQTPVLN